MKYLKIIMFSAVVLCITSCKKWLDVNTDPATPQVTKAEYLLSPIMYQMANNTATDNRLIFKYTQDMFGQDVTTFTVAWEKHGYQSASDLGGSMWRMVYINFGLNLEDMIKDAEATNKWTYAGIGYAIKAWGFQLLTDAHGPVILDEAYANQLKFKYQDQPEVYARVRQWSQKALECFNKTDANGTAALLAGVSGDQMYKGDRVKWRKFVYGLLAQQYSHLINKAEFNTQYADSVVKYVDLSFTSAADDATINFGGSNSNDSNPFSQNFGMYTATATTAPTYGRIGQPVVSLLTGGVRGTAAVDPTTPGVDPRLTRMMNPIPVSGVYRGALPFAGTAATPHILGALTGTSTVPFPGKYIYSNAARYPIMSYAQLQFAKAEALFRKGTTGTAFTAYVNGIKGHMDFINLYGRTGSPAPATISTTEINNYLASTEVAQNAGALTIADIMQQKYIAQWGWAGMEQWSDLRKYHYDPLVYKTYKQLEAGDFFERNNGKYAYRLRPRYSSEYVWNQDELAKWGGLQTDYHTKETWSNLP